MKEDHLYRYEIHTARYQSYQLTNAKTYFIFHIFCAYESPTQIDSLKVFRWQLLVFTIFSCPSGGLVST
jgi:hypothetical protein